MANKFSKLDQFITTIRGLSTEMLRDLAISANTDQRDEADIVLGAVTSELAMRLPEAEFVAFCAELEAVS
jgi:hypothetical protein